MRNGVRAGAARLLLNTALMGLGASSIAAQTLRGVLVDRHTGTPLIGALVVLEDSVGNEQIYGLTDEAGRFTLRVAAPGAHILRVDRPGLESVWSPSILLDAGAITDVRLPVPAHSVDLRGLVSGRGAACAPRPDGGPVTAMLWAEARKALLATVVTDRAGLYHYRLRATEGDSAAGADAEPEWVNAHPLGTIDHHWREAGLVRTTAGNRVYQPPAPPVLLDPLFQSRHCFSAMADTAQVERVGLAFESTGALPPGVNGTLWLDAASGRLLAVEYEYASVSETARPGGRMDFDVLDDGAWIIRSWSYWSAQAEARTANRYEVLAVRPVYDVSPGETLLAGVVFDSVRGRPLAGARVFLWGTDHQTESDERGRFMFGRDVAPGDYEVSFFHESLSEWDLIPVRTSVSLPSGGETFVELATPSLPTIMARECTEDGVVVTGTVRDAGSELPVPLARVVVDWRPEGGDGPQRRMTRTDVRGWFRVCGVPHNVGVAASAQVGEGEWTPPIVVAADRDVVLHHLTLGVTGTVRVVGRLVNAETNEPVGGAMVSLLGMDRRVESNGEGEFVFDELPPGFYEVAVLHPEHGAVSDTLTVRDVGEMDFELRLGGTERAIDDADRFHLDPIVVTGLAVERSLTGFYRRRSQGFGGFLTSAEWEVWNPLDVTDIVRRLPSFIVQPNGTYGQMIGGQLDTRRYRIDTTRRSSRDGIQKCAPLIFLDGALVGNARNFDVDQLMVQTLDAAESYPGGASMPPIFNVTGSQCGVVAFWTKR